MTDLAQSAQDQDQQDPTVAAQPPVPVVPIPAPGPWSADLEAAFPDPAQRAAVDNFLRARIQPHTTQLEQQVAAARQATQFLDDFRANPLDTYVSVTAELFGEDEGQKVLDFIQQQLNGAPATPENVEAVIEAAADPRTEAALSWVEQQQAEKAYNDELKRIKTAHPEVQDDDFHAFVAATEGDFDRAYTLYSAFVQKYGQPVQVTVDDEPAPVIGSDTGAAQASSTPTEPKAQTINGAIDEMMNDFRAAKEAPPVGSI